MKNENLYKFLLMLGDNSMILGHRISELCGHGPSLETDIALTNLSLDLFGQVRSVFQYAAQIKGGDATEDSVAMLRYEQEYLNCVMVEQPNEDFAHVIMRQYLFDAFQKLQLHQLQESSDETLVAIANKTIKETNYHLRFSREWVMRLAGGTEVSHSKMQDALNHLYPFSFEMFEETETEKAIEEAGICASPKHIQEQYYQQVQTTLSEAGLQVPETPARHVKGKSGIHSESMGFILAELQYMQRAYPNMVW